MSENESQTPEDPAAKGPHPPLAGSPLFSIGGHIAFRDGDEPGWRQHLERAVLGNPAGARVRNGASGPRRAPPAHWGRERFRRRLTDPLTAPAVFRRRFREARCAHSPLAYVASARTRSLTTNGVRARGLILLLPAERPNEGIVLRYKLRVQREGDPQAGR